MAKQKKLAGYTTVDGVTYSPDDELPDDVAAQITNPNVWASDEDAEAHAAGREARSRRGTSKGHRLATNVTIDGNTYGPDDPLPDDVAAQITNPAVWEGGKLPDLAKGAEKSSPDDDAKAAAEESNPDDDAADTAKSSTATRARKATGTAAKRD